MLLAQSILSNVIQKGLSKGADFCEIYVEETFSSQLELKSSQTNYISGRDLGLGIRLFYGNREFYTYGNALDEKSLLKAVESLAEIGKRQKNSSLSSPTDKKPFIPSFSRSQAKAFKADLFKEKTFLQKIDKELRKKSSLISQCRLSLQKSLKSVQIANSEGLLSFDCRPYFRFNAISYAEGEGGGKESGYTSFGRGGIFDFWNPDILRAKASESVRQALQNLKADPAPAGKMPVIINKGFGGVIFHEACGHGMETSSVAENLSVFSGKIGQRVADPSVSAYDDGTLKGEYGYIEQDDEGEAAQKTVLIEKGILKNYMADKLGAKKMNCAKTGSSRRQDYKFPPTSRMRNTFIAPGNSSLQEMIEDVEFGLFAEHLGGGSVAPGTGNYNFTASSARLIKNGRLDRPVKGASLIGSGLDSLSKIKKVGQELELSPGLCGSISGWVPVTVGQPPILISELTVGGQKQKPEKNKKRSKETQPA